MRFHPNVYTDILTESQYNHLKKIVDFSETLAEDQSPSEFYMNNFTKDNVHQVFKQHFSGIAPLVEKVYLAKATSEAHVKAQPRQNIKM